MKIAITIIVMMPAAALAQVLPPGGFSSGGQPLVTTNQLATQGPLTLYVDGTNGNNANPCTAPGVAACKTEQGARQKIPSIIQDPVTVISAAGVVGAGAYLDGFTRNQRAGSIANDAGAWIKFVGTYTSVADGGNITAVTAGGTGIISSGDPGAWCNISVDTIVSGVYGSESENGFLFQATSGTAQGEMYRIAHNDAGVFMLASACLKAPSIGDHYAIVTPGTIINNALATPSGIGNQAFRTGTTNVSAWFVSGNSSGTYISGESAGMSPWSGSSVDPFISIEGFSFQQSPSIVGVSVNGTENVSVRFNDFDGNGGGVTSIRAAAPAMVRVEGCRLDAGTAGAQLIAYGGLGLEEQNSGGELRVWGNYVRGDFGNIDTATPAVSVTSGNALIAWNEVSDAAPFAWLGGNSSALASGNHFELEGGATPGNLAAYSLGNAAPHTRGAWLAGSGHPTLVVDGDRFSRATDIYVNMSGPGTPVVTFGGCSGGGTAISGTANFLVNIGGAGAVVTICKAPTATTTNDIATPQSTFNLSSLTIGGVGGVFNDETNNIRVVRGN